MKIWLIALITAFSPLISLDSWSQTVTEHDALNHKDRSDLCTKFALAKKRDNYQEDAPPPVRTLDDSNFNTAITGLSEKILYQELGLTPSQDGSYVCLVTDPDNNRREFTLFKVKKIDNILVATAFLEGGKFFVGQEQATTNLFLEIIQFYTDIPKEYYLGINRYFQEFYLRIADKRLKPTSDRIYAVDEPSTTVVMYHSLQGEIKGTAISLNIYLP
jgi:hypothetical protein